MDNVFFADKTRGIFAKSDGSLIFTTGDFNLLCSPFYIPPPFRVYVDNSLDPFVVCFSQKGVMFIFNYKTAICVITTKLPISHCVITKINIRKKGTIVELITNKESYIYNGNWSVLNEDPEKLIPKDNSKFLAQCTLLENDIVIACQKKDMDDLQLSVDKYVLYIANNLSAEKFMSLWHDLIKKLITQLGSSVIENLKNSVQVLQSVDSILPYTDELYMSLYSV